MPSKNKILLIGPLPKPIHGMSICNELIVRKNKLFHTDYIDTANKSFSEDLGKFSFQKVWAGIKPYFKLYKIFKTDIVYITPGQTFLGILKNAPFIYLAKILRKETIIHIHGNFLGRQFKELKGFKKSIFKHIIKQVDKGIVLSEKLRPNLEPFLPDRKIFVLYNFVEQMLLDFSENEIDNKDTSQLKIVFLSNLMTEKGIFDLLKALKILSERNIKFEAKIAGNVDKQIKPKVLKLLQELPGAQYVGIVRDEEKKQLLLQANTFVFPTYYSMEGQPIAILEAMATGNIVLTTKHAGITDIFSHKNGLFIKKRSPEDIAEKLTQLNNNLSKYKKMMLNNHKYVKERYTPDKFLTNLWEILNA
jgi:glycosyltransferase involved in cell wall biosynthesis